MRSRFRSFAGNPRGRRSHGYCRIRQGEATAPSRAHPRSPPACPRCRHPQRTPSASAAMRAPRPKMSISSLALRPRCAPSSRPPIHPRHAATCRAGAPHYMRPTYAAPVALISPANPFSQLHLSIRSLFLSVLLRYSAPRRFYPSLSVSFARTRRQDYPLPTQG